MAAVKKRKDGKDKKKGGLRSFLLNFDTEKRVRAMRVAGLLVSAFTLFTFVAVTSYLFTWKADYSLLSDPDVMKSGTSVDNWAGKLGYFWARFLVADSFGLGSFVLITLFVAASVKLMKMDSSVRLFRTALISVSGAMVFSLILAFVASFSGGMSAFGGGIGGACGAVLVSFFSNLVGDIVTGVVVLICLVVWLLFVSGRFSHWFATSDFGTSRLRAGAVAGNKDGQCGPNMPEEEDAGLATEDTVDPGLDSFIEDSKIPENDTEKDGGFEKESADTGGQPDGEGLVVVKGPKMDTDIKEELPRIDSRAELENYRFPSLDLLDDYASGRHEVAPEELERNNNKIRATLANYKIQIDRITAVEGPSVTLYKIVPAPGVKISAIRNLEEDIAVALGTKGVRVVTLSDSVGIEVANDRPSIVPLKSMLNSDSFRNSKAELPVAIGYTITQKVKTFDLADAPHLLIAGATKQGKSVGLNVIISSLLYAKHPSELKFVFIDPKMVEFSAYAKLLKHYLAVLPKAASEEEEKENAIIKQAKAAEEVLRSLCLEMEERYRLLSKAEVNNIKAYNEKYEDRHLLPTEGHKYLPYMVVVIDEYADLTMSGGSGSEARAMSRSVTTSIVRLAQKGRAAGIHVIIATQRPSVDVITGLIKTNFPTRIAFRTVTRVDSSTILDAPGADKLIGRGDMLYYAGVETERVQCAYVSMDEIKRITNFIGDETGYRACYSTPYYLPEPEVQEGEAVPGGMVDMGNLDPMFEEAAKMVVMNQQGSTSTLQRKLGMGFARAGRVMDQLEAAGIVGPQEGSKARAVLVADYAELDGILKAYLSSQD